jgi:hypothetical protein
VKALHQSLRHGAGQALCSIGRKLERNGFSFRGIERSAPASD